MSKKIWTHEKCKDEASKYINKSDFKKFSSSAYKYAARHKILQEVCSHMKSKIMPNGYWTKDKCKEVCVECKTKKELKRKYVSAYNVIYSNNWVEELLGQFKIMRHSKDYYTFETCQEISLKFKTKKEFRENNYYCYKIALNNKWLDKICSHMANKRNKSKRCIYAYEFSNNSVYVGLTNNLKTRNNNHKNRYDSTVHKYVKLMNIIPELKQLTDFLLEDEAKGKEQFFIHKYKKEGWNILNIAKAGSLGGRGIYWTKEKCQKDASKYHTRTEYQKCSHSSYNSALNNKWLDDICSHMILKQKPNGYWTKEKCQEIALKYNNRYDFFKYNSGI
jgi:predicted GIY-YIG superfamily endonuclease